MIDKLPGVFPPFTSEVFRLLKVGDKVDTEGFFQGITPAPCMWKVETVGDNYATFLITYLGVAVGRFLVKRKKSKYSFEELTLS